jgi:beta-galactosidase
VQHGHKTDSNGFWSATVKYSAPKISLPDFTKSKWKYIDSLPELQSSYDDSSWVAATRNSSNNDVAPLDTPVSLYSSDYGFHTGYLLYRGHFVANGNESSFTVNTQGGTGFGSSVWLNESFLGSWDGNANDANQASTYKLPTTLKSGSNYVFTVLIDNLGLDENFEIGLDEMKDPRGILNYDLSGHSQSDITWKLTGNLGGEDYIDLVRGPLNEGGLYAERQGWHQPTPPSKSWETSSPLSTGLSQPGVGFYSTSFNLNLPKGFDIPLYFVFNNNTSTEQPYRVQLYVNGYQFGKFVPHIGPQGEFPVPQGILNYQGENWVAVTLWAHESSGAKLGSFELVNRTPVLTALSGIAASEQPAYKKRAGAY